jgi:hypothetical protein
MEASSHKNVGVPVTECQGEERVEHRREGPQGSRLTLASSLYSIKQITDKEKNARKASFGILITKSPGYPLPPLISQWGTCRGSASQKERTS